MTRLSFVFGLGLVLGLVVSSAPAEAGPRPGSELALFLRLNGVAQRWTLADGGQSGLYGSAATCMPVSGPQVVVLQCSAAVHICDASTDAGCNTTATDINYGRKTAADTERFIVVDDGISTSVCMVPVTGSANCPAWNLR